MENMHQFEELTETVFTKAIYIPQGVNSDSDSGSDHDLECEDGTALGTPSSLQLEETT